MMGYYFGLARFNRKRQTVYLIFAFLLPFIFHGLYDFLLMGNTPVLLTTFVPVFIFFWISGFRKMSLLSDASAFRNTYDDQIDSGDDML